jgi:2-C-methyl-D-erythritol 4-phosphate cytidylyltransferase
MDASSKAAAIIVAAGEGLRMGGGDKKQFVLLGDRPVMAHCLCAFEACDVVEEVFVVIAEGDRTLCRERVISPLRLKKKIHLIPGGATRQASVFNGLRATEERFPVVAIHDAVRPLIKSEQIAECVRVAETHGACIPVIPATDTVKRVDEESRVVATLNRQMIRMAQTPQAFQYWLIYKAHLAAREEGRRATDDAELVERCGGMVRVVAGDPYNIKITVPTDLKVAEALLALEEKGL